MHKVLFLFLVFIPMQAFAALDYNVFNKLHTYQDYEQQEQLNNLEQQRIQQQIYLMQEQQRAIQQQQNQAAPTQAVNKPQIYMEALIQIVTDCTNKRLQGNYKTKEASLKKCIRPQGIKLAHQMNMPNIGAIRALLDYMEKVYRLGDAGKITEGEAGSLLERYVATH